jgi:PASTA domain
MERTGRILKRAAGVCVLVAALVVPATALASPPVNDNFANAQVVSGDTGTVAGTTVDATFEAGEPEHAYDGSGASVWYRWTAPSSGWATFGACNSNFDTVLAVYTGSTVNTLASVSGDWGWCSVRWEAVAGAEYRIAVDGYYDRGDFTLAWNRTPPPPYWTDAPTVSGAAVDGSTLTGSLGSWTGVQPMTYAYAWGRCDGYQCTPIAGATSPTYTLGVGDIGYTFYFEVTATNAGGSTTAWSGLTPRVAPRSPENAVAPIVSGTAAVGELLQATPGSWAGTLPISFTYQWQRCDAVELTCIDLPGQTGSALQLTDDLAGYRVRVVVTGANAGGSASVVSEPSELIVRPCTVPKLKGKTAAAARKAIGRASCTIGRVRRAYSSTVRAGRVSSQSPRAGTKLAHAGKVSFVVSKGKKKVSKAKKR